MGWVTVAELLLLVIALALVLTFVWLLIRRRLIARNSGGFDCSARLSTSSPGAGWVLGVARYSGEWLEWYRVFGLSLRPARRFERGRTTIGERRLPSAVEAVVLYDGLQILELIDKSSGVVEVAMSAEAVTGLLAWLEAAPPGQGRYGNVAT